MFISKRLAALVLLSCALWFTPTGARGAESFDNCTGYIDSLPATITTQGTWCMRKDLATSINMGNAVTIATNNVIIDCNDYKIGGLGGGLGTSAAGIVSVQNSNITIRHCNVRGFKVGISLGYDPGGAALTAGDVIEDNRLDGNTLVGILVQSDGATVRRNAVVDTGGSTFATEAIGISATSGVDIVDNLIDGVSPTDASEASTYGIFAMDSQGTAISGNRIRNVIANSTAFGIGLASDTAGVAVLDNVIYLPDGTGTGIVCFDPQNSDVVVRNLMTGPGTGLSNCRDGGGNIGG
ncbi:NosD domain-containing protein [Cognatiluteimonas telluris]|jgi:hypothetical protein|uniref:NosD domain-containing protein n=1 Tax=Cognatiluteimonas telluris TaxID=1104775 RepID=UPI00140D7A58|nr:NosD domain-containing protein [Lysobacter telluris]